MLILRSRRPGFRSRPGKYLVAATLAIVAATLVFPFSPLAGLFGFTRLPPVFLLVVGGITFWYAVAAELGKVLFYRREKQNAVRAGRPLP